MKIIRNEHLELVFPAPKDRPQAARAKPGPLAAPPVLTDSVTPAATQTPTQKAAKTSATTAALAPAPAKEEGVIYIGSANKPPLESVASQRLEPTLQMPKPAPAQVSQASEPAKKPESQSDFGANVTNLDNLSLEKQLEYGLNRGVFTKLAISKDGVLVAKPRHTDPRAQTDGFATTAAATIKDFEEGIASLKKHLGDVGDNSRQGLAGRFRSLQQFTSKLSALA